MWLFPQHRLLRLSISVSDRELSLSSILLTSLDQETKRTVSSWRVTRADSITPQTGSAKVRVFLGLGPSPLSTLLI